MDSQSSLFLEPVVSVLQPKVYQFTIILVGIAPAIWRRIQVPSDCGFFAFHSAILDVMGWVDNRLYNFETFSRRPEAKSIGLPFNINGVPSYEDDTLITEYFTIRGDTAVYVYDDQWPCNVMLDCIVNESVGVSYPVSISGERRSACERVGGLQSYRWQLKMATKPDHPMQLSNAQALAALGHLEYFNPKSIVFQDPRKRFNAKFQS